MFIIFVVLECTTKSYVNLELISHKAKVKFFIPMYEPLEGSKCEKCGKVIAEQKELI